MLVVLYPNMTEQTVQERILSYMNYKKVNNLFHIFKGLAQTLLLTFHMQNQVITTTKNASSAIFGKTC